jgi:hypothetical protein
MRTTRTLFISAVTLNMLLAVIPAIASESICPSSINEAPSVAGADAQWTVVASFGERRLEHVGIYLGNLSDYGAQVPDSTKQNAKTETVTWRITRSKGDIFWIGCSYVGTTAMLFQQLDDTVSACVASYDLLRSGKRLRLKSLDCR